ncbi:MAG: L-ribulose-5-phosphate 4-epimerase AraD [archaeon]|nr:L-ribulose-5-phosphate 4-epimerase AraD [archaeon]
MKKNKIIRDIRIANQNLADLGLVKLTFGNASGKIDSKTFGIKPSGVLFKDLRDRDIVLMKLNDGEKCGKLNPSVDYPIHLEIYSAFPEVGGIVHTHSTYATAFAQANKPIFCLGTTHADYFYGYIPSARELTSEEIKKNYEKNIGRTIIDTFSKDRLDYQKVQACLVPGHGSFVWGEDVEKAIENAFVLEEIAKIAFYTLAINPEIKKLNDTLLDKHFLRKHGPNSYYGQRLK